MDYFDFIIVGGGSAGCVLAESLSRSSRFTVLLVEAGPGDKDPLIAMPAGAGRLIGGKAYNWAYQTEPQPNLGGRSLYWPRGKVLGGSSSINAMIHIRGHQADYDDWAARGLPGWDYDSVKPFFTALEEELAVAPLHTPDPFFERFLAAGQALGYPSAVNFNNGAPEGFGRFPLAIHKGERQSAARVFLHKRPARPNLEIITQACVTRVLCEAGRACAIEFLRDGEIRQVRARAEIILSAGAVNSPQILMLSGIGPAKDLRDLGIDVIADKKEVGAHLQDHPSLTFHFERQIPLDERALRASQAAQDLYRESRSGPLASQALEAGAFLRTNPELARPDLQIHALAAYMRDHGRRKADGPGVTFLACLLRPRSKGRVFLNSPNPRDPARIDPAYLQDPADLEALAQSAILTRKLAAHPVWDGLLGRELHPGRRVDREGAFAIAEDVKAALETLYHPTGTVGMGRVLDHKLKVQGVDGLRVIDASSFPDIPSANTNAATMMVALKGAQMILEQN